jgi:hypothetical protein
VRFRIAGRATGNQGKDWDMRDELDGRMWVDHHDGFGDLVDNAGAALRAGIARFAGWDGSTHQLLAMVAAWAVTGLSLTITNNAA